MRLGRIIELPIGALHVVAQDGAIVSTAFDAWGLPDVSLGDDEVLTQAARWVDRWLLGALEPMPALRLQGTAFQQVVWRAVADIPLGATASYRSIAVAVGRPQGAQAVGAANGANPVLLFVPCHRVVGTDGALTGYAGGLERKRWMLTQEGALAQRSLF